MPTFPRQSATVQMVNSTGETKVEYRQKLLRQYLLLDNESARKEPVVTIKSFALTDGEEAKQIFCRSKLTLIILYHGTSLHDLRLLLDKKKLIDNYTRCNCMELLVPRPASPVVLFHKEDGSLCFFIGFNTVTKLDVLHFLGSMTC